MFEAVNRVDGAKKVEGNNGGVGCGGCAGKAGARQLEVSLRAVGQAMLDLQQLWVELAPHSPW